MSQRLSPPVSGTRRPSRFTELSDRMLLVAKARWLLLLLFGLYGLMAAALFAFSRYGLFLDRMQIVTLVVSVLAVVGYNSLCHLRYQPLSRVPYFNALQIFLDLLFVTILIHFSGGAASWFWPVYLVVTIEAAILLERKRQVFLMGMLGSGIYGLMLLAEYGDLIAGVPMPFVDPSLHHDALQVSLIWFWVSVMNATVAVISGFLMSVIRRENEALKASEEQLVQFLDSANDLIFCASPDSRLLYVNQAWLNTLGYRAADVSRLRLLDIIDQSESSRCAKEFERVLGGPASVPLEGKLRASDGREVIVEGNLTNTREQRSEAVVWGICRDITERKRAQQQLYHMAHHDTLTGLPNRLYFVDRLKQCMALAKRLEKQVAVLFLDLDRFKIINDTLGHAAGDALLIEMAKRLEEKLRETDAVGRLGGDEFAIVLGNLNFSSDAEKVANKILKGLAEPVVIEKHDLHITTSIGISFFPDHHEAAEELLKKADIAMYSAKSKGRNNVQVYDSSLDLDSDRRLVLEHGIRKALDKGEFRIFYQPKIDLRSGQVFAMEALLRWQHPELGLLPPKDFISLAEETGMIFALGEWVLRQVCLQNRSWQQEGLAKIRVAVNLSGYQLQHKGLVPMIEKILTETGLEPSLLELEVTETVVMQNPDFAVMILRELKNLGIHISIDDFGTGYSSLSHLKRFSVNTLKIDKSFIRDVDRNTTDAAIATAIISMGNSLELNVIAEGVETESQLHFLRQHDCHEIQGFLYSQPVPVELASEMLRNGIRIRSVSEVDADTAKERVRV